MSRRIIIDPKLVGRSKETYGDESRRPLTKILIFYFKVKLH